MNESGKLIFVRHGESTGNFVSKEIAQHRWSEKARNYVEAFKDLSVAPDKAGLQSYINFAEDTTGKHCGGKSDSQLELTDKGRMQSLEVGDKIRNVLAKESPFVVPVVYTSEYTRARQTADVAMKQAGVNGEWVVDSRLNEKDCGEEYFSLRNRPAYFLKNPSERLKIDYSDLRSLFNYKFIDGESNLDVAKRAVSFLDDLDTSKINIVFSHQLTILVLRFLAQGVDIEDLYEKDIKENLLNNAEVLEYQFQDGIYIKSN